MSMIAEDYAAEAGLLDFVSLWKDVMSVTSRLESSAYPKKLPHFDPNRPSAWRHQNIKVRQTPTRIVIHSNQCHRSSGKAVLPSMSLATLYNSLPCVEDASDAFKDRDAMFAKLAPLLAAYQLQFGVCLVHAHCAIEEGEAMVAKGNISRPMRDVPQHPERWLADGTPYEFSQEPTKTPPAELVRDFQAIVGKDTTLGLFYSNNPPDGKVWLEHTEGRDNIVELVDKDKMPNHLETGWIPGVDDPLMMACTIICRKPDKGGKHMRVHLGGS
ncbi:hypothetical protein RSOL_163380 [Rhizoctonia solani AG-3 Rhs1AP]|uniref:Uncharacterized protein n=2 Tax=Rhizoctonia solani AG-3 TaxID=1086053 RepID=A0A074RUE8_9AGAM|nr:hypothetical protein RSOL_163380 [Rhizoctonia solani AG-3 Rhs1AP]KEP50721.1 hypothetical protein V565_074620 [Rhizoctonia solani 123E]